MSNLKKHAVSLTGRLHLRGADDELLYADDAHQKPMVAIVYGPGSKEYQAAQTEQSNRSVDLLRKKGKSAVTPEEAAEAKAKFLCAITQGIENLTDNEPVTTDKAVLKEHYEDPELGFIGDQIAKYANEWGNFKKPSAAS
jgi:hypothetical protein